MKDKHSDYFQLGKRIALPNTKKKSEDCAEEREKRILMYQERAAMGLDLYTGKPLKGEKENV